MSKKFRRSTDTLFENFDGETVILNLADGCYYGLDATGKLLWEALAIPKSIPELCLVLEENFETVNEPVQTHVEEFLAQLIGPGLAQIEQSEI